jgi:LmbE family N-acetylglucosaminyl deacetylase
MSPTSKPVARFLLIAFFSLASLPAAAQEPFSGTPEVEHSLRRLNELGRVLMIAAHPDDERTAVLAYFARGRHMRTAYLSLTRGEGGQNLIGSEQGAALGIIRTQELLDARRIDGAEQFFTRAIDFGFTKTAAEAIQKWGHDQILSDIVWVIRRFQPDVVILCFTGTPRDGHGQHQASAILGKEGFDAAGDPQRFPEQLKYVQPWKPRRLVHAGGFFGERSATPVAQAPPKAGEAETGQFNPILGYSYEELAILSRNMHHSQGTGAMRRLGAARTPFELLEGTLAEHDLFEGIDTSWAGRFPQGGAAVGAILDEAIRKFEPAHPEQVIPLLLSARSKIAAFPGALAREKLAELDETVALCGGVWADAQARQAEFTPGSPFSFTVTVLNRSNVPVTFEGGQVEGLFQAPLDVKPARLGYNQSAAAEFSRPVPDNEPYSQPYWLIQPPAGSHYRVADPSLIGLPEAPALARVRLRLTVNGTPVELVRPVHYRYADRAQGERDRPVLVVPPVTVELSNSHALFPSAAPRRVQVSVKANVKNASGDLRLEAPAGWKVEPPSRGFQIAVSGEQEQLDFTVTPPAEASEATLRAIASLGGREVTSGMHWIEYPHIPTQAIFPPADLRLVRADVRVTAHKIGYIMGAGDEMPDALRQLGLDVTLLSPSDLEQGDLSRFDAIVAGIRAYNVRPDLKANQPRLMEYVRNGGTYIVQYQNGEAARGGPGGPGQSGQPTIPPSNIGPYPITIPGGNTYRVTVEDAPVHFPHPDSPLLHTPNEITPSDFQGWVQERGLLFAIQWDPHYETVLASSDPGEKPLEGGELWTRYGKGVYIFTSYAWFRQLPAGVPGAYRLFANLLSAK